MSKRSRLDVVLRARQAQEDVVKGTVLRARAATHAAAEAVSRRERDLAESGVPTAGSAGAVVAALAARQAMAAAASVARQTHRAAEQETAARIADLTEAAKRRQVMEKLVDKYYEAERALELAVEQGVLDEIAITAGQRAGAQGVVKA